MRAVPYISNQVTFVLPAMLSGPGAIVLLPQYVLCLTTPWWTLQPVYSTVHLCRTRSYPRLGICTTCTHRHHATIFKTCAFYTISIPFFSMYSTFVIKPYPCIVWNKFSMILLFVNQDWIFEFISGVTESRGYCLSNIKYRSTRMIFTTCGVGLGLRIRFG